MNSHHDQSLDRALRRIMPELVQSSQQRSCPDAETVAAWVEADLPASEAALVETHLSNCARCQEVVATLVRAGAAPVPLPSESLWRRWRLQWLVPAAAAVTAVAVWVALPVDRRSAVNPAVEAPAPRTLEEFNQAGGGIADDSNATSLQRVAPAPAEAGQFAVSPSAPAAAEKAAIPQTDTALRDEIRAEASNRALAEAAAPSSPPPAPAPVGETVLSGRRQAALSAQARADASVEIRSPDPVNRWRIVAGSRVERSTTAGSTWEPAVVSAPTQLEAASSPAPTVCWLAGRAGGVWLTTDGAQFDRLPFPEPVDLVDVRATSDTSAIVTAADGRAFRTNDRGVTWSLVAP